MRSLSMLAVVLPAVLAVPLEVTTHHQYSPSSCVIADVAYPDPRHALVLLGRRELSPPTGLSERTFTDLLVWCHELGRSSTGLLVARQESGCPSGAQAFGGPVGSDSTVGTMNPGGAPQNSSASGDQNTGSSAAGSSTTPETVTPDVTPANSVARPTSPGDTPSETPGDATGSMTSGTSTNSPANSDASNSDASNNAGTPANPAGSSPSGNAAVTTGPADSNTSDNGSASETPQSAPPTSATPSTATSPIIIVDGTSPLADTNASDSLNNTQTSGIAASSIPSGATPQAPPDDTVNSGTTSQTAPDGTVNGGTTPQTSPDGTVNGGTPAPINPTASTPATSTDSPIAGTEIYGCPTNMVEVAGAVSASVGGAATCDSV
ncbi:hypothetical protein BDR03DRAFT_1054532 [Suillus americanus]|nr:hypothetical protein BDR03DRAFT_1054532 [Suillus americanus]